MSNKFGPSFTYMPTLPGHFFWMEGCLGSTDSLECYKKTGWDAVHCLFVTCTKTVLTRTQGTKYWNTSKYQKPFLEMTLPKNTQHKSTRHSSIGNSSLDKKNYAFFTTFAWKWPSPSSVAWTSLKFADCCLRKDITETYGLCTQRESFW